jgi:hypothetical protein
LLEFVIVKIIRVARARSRCRLVPFLKRKNHPHIVYQTNSCSEMKEKRKLRGDIMDRGPTPLPFRLVTYSAIAQKLDHAQSLFDIGDLLFEPTPPLRQVAVHIAVLPTETNIAEGRWGR